MSISDSVDRELRRLHRLTAATIGLLTCVVLLGMVFAVHEFQIVQGNQQQLEELTLDLCTTLERAGILIQGSSQNPCAR